jgi:phytoene/squalene synthetase
MFLGGGRAVAAAIERCDCDTLARRPTVGRGTKLALAARAWWQATLARCGADS